MSLLLVMLRSLASSFFFLVKGIILKFTHTCGRIHRNFNLTFTLRLFLGIGDYRQKIKNVCDVGKLFSLLNLIIFEHLFFHSVLAGLLKAVTLSMTPKGIRIVRFSSPTGWLTSSDAQKNKNKCKITLQSKELQ